MKAPQTLRVPPPLGPGDAVALISPSSHMGRNPSDYLEEAARILTGWGLRVRAVETPEPRHLYLSGEDSHRAAQFQSLYLDPEIKALFVTRGGYGAARMLPLLERHAIAGAPAKAVVGFSDVTALFAYLNTVAGISVVHGPCLAAPSLLHSPAREQELAGLKQALFDPSPLPAAEVCSLYPEPTVAEGMGRLVGGCLSVVVTTIGTPWELDTRGAILFLEDIAEAPYRIDRLVTHLRTAGKLDELHGLVLGHFTDCDSDPPGLLAETLLDLLGGLPFPVAQGLASGHGVPNLPLRLGGLARLSLQPGEGEQGGGRLYFL